MWSTEWGWSRTRFRVEWHGWQWPYRRVLERDWKPILMRPLIGSLSIQTGRSEDTTLTTTFYLRCPVLERGRWSPIEWYSEHLAVTCGQEYVGPHQSLYVYRGLLGEHHCHL